MDAETPTAGTSEIENRVRSADVRAIVIECGWMDSIRDQDANEEREAWFARAAYLLGPHVIDLAAPRDLLGLVFEYDAVSMLREFSAQSVMARSGAREVIRELANRVLDGVEIASDRFKEIIDVMKVRLPYRGRAMFHPIRMALAGRIGEGELDRVILLLDPGAKLEFAVKVKSARERMIEFCAALD